MSTHHQIYIAGSLSPAFKAASYFGGIDGDTNTNRPCPVLVATLPGGYALYLQTMHIATRIPSPMVDPEGYGEGALTVFEKSWSIV